MVAKEKIKKEIDKLPEDLLDQVYQWLKQITSKNKMSKTAFTVRDFNLLRVTRQLAGTLSLYYTAFLKRLPLSKTGGNYEAPNFLSFVDRYGRGHNKLGCK